MSWSLKAQCPRRPAARSSRWATNSSWCPRSERSVRSLSHREISVARSIRARAAAPLAISHRPGTLDSILVSGIARNDNSSPAFAPPPAPRWHPTPIAYDVGAIVALSLAVCLFHLGSFGLWEPDEGRHAGRPPGVVESGNL